MVVTIEYVERTSSLQQLMLVKPVLDSLSQGNGGYVIDGGSELGVKYKELSRTGYLSKFNLRLVPLGSYIMITRS